MIKERLISLAVGYIFGLFQTAFFYGKLHGIDIREHGSGNSGTTNALRVLGRKAGLIVFLGDCLKAMAAVFLIRFLFGNMYPDLKWLLALYTGAGVILGHNYPFYMHFKGGKGIAATGGMVLSFHPIFIPVGLVAFFGTFFLTHYVSLGSLCVYAAFMIQMPICGQLGVLGDLPQGILNEMYVITGMLTVLAYWKHRENIKRLLQGNERKTYLSKKKREEEKQSEK